MGANVAASRYARALLVCSQGNPAKALEHRRIFSELVEIFKDRAIAEVLSSPIVNAEIKRAALIGAVEGMADQDFKNFLSIVADARRVAALPQIFAVFSDLLDERENRVNAVIESAVPLSPEVLANVVESLKTTLRKEISVATKVNPDIMGGLWIRVGHQVLDLTMKSQLEALTAGSMR